MSDMRVVFRADASREIGSGHVMRCLTLADGLANKGVECEFISRRHDGNLIDFIRTRGYVAHELPKAESKDLEQPLKTDESSTQEPVHYRWLGVTQAKDAEDCANVLYDIQPDWLVVDHYGVDERWEKILEPYYRKLMVIDDLADRNHACDVLLDQTLGRKGRDYAALVPAECRLLCGSEYALLRPEFAAIREYSLERRKSPCMRELIITMGGVDNGNATGLVLAALRNCSLPSDCRITVVMGALAPCLNEVLREAGNMPWHTRVLVGVNNMMELLAESDLAIGAAGTTSWERCCLGVPTIMVVLAENQREIASALSQVGAAYLFDISNLKIQKLVSAELTGMDQLQAMSAAAAAVTDGFGVSRVTEILTAMDAYAN